MVRHSAPDSYKSLQGSPIGMFFLPPPSISSGMKWVAAAVGNAL